MRISSLFLFLLCFCRANAQQLNLIKDINPGAASSNICYLTSVSDKLFFAANDGAHGMELWKSNGTEAGTVLVKDINSGVGNSGIGYLTEVNHTLFFVANNGINGTELWKSDGTDAGTVLVKDIRIGSMGSNPSELANVNGILFFAANNGSNGVELWKSDGTEAGTVMVKDINPGIGSGYPQSSAALNGVLFFAADNGSNGTELWKSDGTTAGTNLVKDIWVGTDEGYPFDLAAMGNYIYFSASDGNSGIELWKSDGTSGGTVRLKDIQAGAGDSNPYDLLNVAGTLFFSADNGMSGTELWKSDGTASGTTMVRDIWMGPQSGVAGNFTKLINQLVFTANDGLTGYRTWQSDGTSLGTGGSLGLLNLLEGTMQELTETDNTIFASITSTSIGSELWGANFSPMLPLHLLEFNGQLVKNDAVLSWKTSEEVNTSEFIIEKSVDGTGYEPIGKVSAVNAIGTNQYKFTDAGITFYKKETLHYRLRIVNMNGQAEYSKTVSLQSAYKGSNELKIYPNPAVHEINIKADILSGLVNYEVFDNTGKMLLKESRQVIAGSGFRININKLPAGIYFLDLHSAGFEKRVQFVKQH